MKLILITLIFLMLGCETSDTNEAMPGNPILKDYVKRPQDKANIASKLNDKHNRMLEENLQELSE